MDQASGVPGSRSLLAASGGGQRPSLVQDASAFGWDPPLPTTRVQASDAYKKQETPQAKEEKKKKRKAAAAASAGRSRRGWGPFRSVLKERSVDFNLTLDVQSLKQEIRDMVMLRELLQTKTLVQRHSPDGSLLKAAREFYCVFRTGFVATEGRKRSFREQEQWDYLYSTMDERVDVGNGLFGPEVMGQQLQIYSTFIRYLSLSLENFNIITADESVVVATRGTFRFQVLRNTIQQIFPHVMGNEELVARLIGRQVEVLAKLTFYFNTDGKCAKYEVDIDFLVAFATIVTNPHDLDLLFGRALIAENCMFGLLESSEAAPAHPITPDECQSSTLGGQEPLCVPQVSSDDYDAAQCGYDGIGGNVVESVTGGVVSPLERAGDAVGARGELQQDYCASPSVPPRDTHAQRVDSARRLVRAYFSVYSPTSTAPGAPQPAATGRHSISEERFIANYCEPHLRFRRVDGWVGLKEKWSDLRGCFDVINFRLVHEESVGYDARFNAPRVDTVGVYVLGITPRTVQLVFPHVAAHPSLLAALEHRTVHVKSLLTFWVSGSTGKLQRVDERMDFPAALGGLVTHPADVAFVLDHALLTADGILRASPWRVAGWEQEPR